MKRIKLKKIITVHMDQKISLRKLVVTREYQIELSVQLRDAEK